MSRDATTGVTFPSWKAWTAKFAWRRAMFREQLTDLGGKRARAEKRAIAAEVIAQEANAARFKALLDAAREQEAVQTIESAERRFEEAKGAWQAALAPLNTGQADAAAEYDGEPAVTDAGQARVAGAGRFRLAAILLGGNVPVSGGQVALRSTAAAGLILGGLYVYFDPDIWDEELLGAVHTTVAAPEPQPEQTFGDIDPLVSMSWPRAESESMRADPPSSQEDAAPAVRKVSAAKAAEAPTTQVVPRRRTVRLRLVPEAAPTPPRNPFYLVPNVPVVQNRPGSTAGIE